MFSEAEQIRLQSFLTDLEKDDSKNANESSSSTTTTKKHTSKKRMKPYTKTKSRSPSTSNEGDASTKSGRARKPAHELLSENQKKANHIASEQKRRANIRIGFDQLVDMVPDLDNAHRSESLILQKSVDYIRELIKDKDQLKQRARELQTVLGEVPDDDSSEGETDY